MLLLLWHILHRVCVPIFTWTTTTTTKNPEETISFSWAPAHSISLPLANGWPRSLCHTVAAKVRQCVLLSTSLLTGFFFCYLKRRVSFEFCANQHTWIHCFCLTHSLAHSQSSTETTIKYLSSIWTETQTIRTNVGQKLCSVSFCRFLRLFNFQPISMYGALCLILPHSLIQFPHLTFFLSTIFAIREFNN